MNVICITGRMVREVELRTTTTGKSVATFSVAVQKNFKPTDGSPDADFFNVCAWGQQAMFAAEYLEKGRLVEVVGRMQSRKYTASDGSNREVWEVVADSLKGLDRPRDDSKPSVPRQTTAAPGVDDWDPFADE